MFETKNAGDQAPATVELKQLGENLRSTMEQFKALAAKEEEERKKYGQATAETAAELKKMNDRMDDLEKKQQRSVVTNIATKASAADQSEETKSFLAWARSGFVSPEERKALRQPDAGEFKSLSIGNDTTGGYLAPIEQEQAIIKAVVEFSPIRSLARVRPTSSRASRHPKRTGTFAAVWVAEQGTRSETTGLTYGREEIPNHELYALVDISQQDLEDSAFDLAAELNMEFSEQFGVAEGTAFVNGTGVAKPWGFMNDTGSVSQEVVSGDANLVKAEGIFDMIYGIKDAYARNASFVLKRATIGAIRKLKDATSGQFLWQPGLNGPTSNTIAGYSYAEAIDMPSVGAGLYPIAFGDWRRAYVISDRVGIQVLRDPYTQATSGNVRFIARKRVGGQVVLGEALIKLKIST